MADQHIFQEFACNGMYMYSFAIMINSEVK